MFAHHTGRRPGTPRSSIPIRTRWRIQSIFLASPSWPHQGLSNGYDLYFFALPVVAVIAFELVRTDQQLVRSREDIAWYSADVASYLEGSPALTLWGDTFSSAGQETDLFPGQTGQTGDWAWSIHELSIWER